MADLIANGESGASVRAKLNVLLGAPALATVAPYAPSGVLAKADDAKARLAWTAPDGGGQTSYLITASPGGATMTATTESATFTGLTNGTAYTFTVKAVNAVGQSAASVASNSVTPTAAIAGLAASAGVLVRLSAASLTGYTNTDPVGAFTDLSGNNYAAAATSTKRPTYLASWTNGKPALSLTTPQTMILSNLTTVITGSAITVFIVFSLTSSTNGSSEKDQRLISNQLNLNDSFKFNVDMFASSGNAVRTLVSGTNSPSAAITTTTPYLFSVTAPGSAYLNGVKAAVPVNAPYKNTAAFYLGSVANTLRYFTGNIAEVWIFDRLLNDTDRHAVEAYLATQYGLSVSVQ